MHTALGGTHRTDQRRTSAGKNTPWGHRVLEHAALELEIVHQFSHNLAW